MSEREPIQMLHQMPYEALWNCMDFMDEEHRDEKQYQKLQERKRQLVKDGIWTQKEYDDYQEMISMSEDERIKKDILDLSQMVK